LSEHHTTVGVPGTAIACVTSQDATRKAEDEQVKLRLVAQILGVADVSSVISSVAARSWTSAASRALKSTSRVICPMMNSEALR
jgi:hypothetical protein